MYRCTIKKVQYSYVNMFSCCENILLMQPLQKLFLLLYAILQKLFLSLYMPYFRNCFYRYLPYFRNCYIPYFRNCFWSLYAILQKLFLSLYAILQYCNIFNGNLQMDVLQALRPKKKDLYRREGKCPRCCLGDRINKMFPCRANYFAPGRFEDKDEFILFSDQDDLKIRMYTSYFRIRMTWRKVWVHAK